MRGWMRWSVQTCVSSGALEKLFQGTVSVFKKMVAGRTDLKTSIISSSFLSIASKSWERDGSFSEYESPIIDESTIA
jgi:hypothetical protein